MAKLSLAALGMRLDKVVGKISSAEPAVRVGRLQSLERDRFEH